MDRVFTFGQYYDCRRCTACRYLRQYDAYRHVRFGGINELIWFSNGSSQSDHQKDQLAQFLAWMRGRNRSVDYYCFHAVARRS